MTLGFRTSFICLIVMLSARAQRVRWSQVRCSTDVRAMPEGRVQDSGRFPWLGLLQHSFKFENFSRFAISPAILIHPAYALAGARDVQAIPEDRVRGFTQFVSMRSGGGRSALPAVGAVLHPEFPRRSLASLALVQLDPSESSYFGQHDPGPVLPVCLPFSGVGVLDDQFYTVQMTDQGGALGKKVFRMKYLEDSICDEFFARAGLNYTLTTPASSVCVVSALSSTPCVWDEGSALITKQSWALYKLMGFGVRGPGCGAPARFLYIHQYLPWIEEVMASAQGSFLGLGSSARRAGSEGGQETLYFEQDNPYEILMSRKSHKSSDNIGNCNRKERGPLVYKEQTKVSADSGYVAHGFFYLEVHSKSTFSCVKVRVEAEGSSPEPPSIWLEHHCYRNDDGRVQFETPYAQRCFKYYITTAHLKFGFKIVREGRVLINIYANPPLEPAPLPPNITGTTRQWEPTTTDLFLPRMFRGPPREDIPTEW